MSHQQVLIISGDRNWIFRKSVFFRAIILATFSVLAVIFFLLYWYLQYYMRLNEQTLVYHQTQLENAQLLKQMQEMQIQHEKQLDDLKFRYHSEAQNVRKVSRVVESLALSLKKEDGQETLLDLINRLRGALQDLAISSYDAPINSNSLISINRFRAINDGKKTTVQFQIKAFKHDQMPLKLAVIPLSQNQLNLNLLEEPPDTQSIQLEKDHLFKKSFTHPQTDDSFAAIRVILWDQNQQILFEQNYPILKRDGNLIPN